MPDLTTAEPDETPRPIGPTALASALKAAGLKAARPDASTTGYALYIRRQPHWHDLFPGEVMIGYQRLGDPFLDPITDPVERDALTAAMTAKGWHVRWSGQRTGPHGDDVHGQTPWYLIVRRPTPTELRTRKETRDV